MPELVGDANPGKATALRIVLDATTGSSSNFEATGAASVNKDEAAAATDGCVNGTSAVDAREGTPDATVLATGATSGVST